MGIVRSIILPDVHLDEGPCSPAYTLVRNKFLPQNPCDQIILLGDFLDIFSLSKFNDDKPQLSENKRLAAEIARGNAELDYLSCYCRRIIYIEGNHEHRIVRRIEENPMALDQVIDLPLQLYLEDRGVEWVPEAKLLQIGKCFFTHGVWYNAFHAAKHIRAYGCSIVYGHTHNAQTHQLNMKMQAPIMAYGLGCLCDEAPEYMRGRPTNWINQFATFDHNEKTGRFNVTPINITDHQFLHNGIEYR